jgi:hypothetical protein
MTKIFDRRQNGARSGMRRAVQAAWGWAEPSDGDEYLRQASVSRHGGWREMSSFYKRSIQAVRPRSRGAVALCRPSITAAWQGEHAGAWPARRTLPPPYS